MSYSYQWSLIAFSVFIAIFASYTTLRIALRMAGASRETLPYWVAGGACSMGIGIWAMHFVGMLALHLPVPVAFDPVITAFSVLPAILASAIALYTLQRPQSGLRTRAMVSVLMGLGIVAMHYSGMAAMKMSPSISYDGTLFVLSVLVAVGASWGALFLAFQELRAVSVSFWRRLSSAMIMGLAIAGMHYTGMAAAEFAPGSVCNAASTGLSGNAIGLLVGLVALVVLLASLALTFYDEVLGENKFFKALQTAQSDAGQGVLLLEQGQVIYVNPAMLALSGYSEEDIRTKNVRDSLLGGLDPALFNVSMSDAAAQRQHGRSEILLKMRDGSGRPCEMVVTSFRHVDRVRHLLLFIDVSDRKAADEAHRAREAEYRELSLVASRTDNAVIITDAQGVITWVNKGFEQITGYSLVDVLGKKPGSLLQGPDTDRETCRRVREALAQGKGFEAELVNYHKSGRKYWVSIDAKPVHDEAGNLTKFIAIEKDITERKLAEEMVRKSVDRTKEAEQLAHVGSFENDLDERGPIFSEEALRILELDSPDGRATWERIFSVIHPDDHALLKRKREEALASKSGYAVEHRLLFPDGRIKYVNTDAAVYCDKDGEPTRIIGSVQDITEKKKVEQALQASEAEARELAVVASSTDNGVLIMDPKARIIWVNDGFVRMSGFSLDEVVGRRPGELLNGPDTDPDTLAFIQDKVMRGERFETELVHYQKSGEKYWAVIDVQPVRDESGRVIKLISMERDITSRKLAEQALRESEMRLQEAQQLAHIGSWAHDLAREEYLMSVEALRIHEFDAPDGRVPRAVVAAAMLPEDSQALARHLQRALDTLGTYSHQLRLHLPGERIKHVHIRGAVHADAQGKPVRVIGTIQDITEQKLAETALVQLNETLEERVLERTQELEQQNTFIETILDTAETLIFVVDAQGRFVRFNKACERLTGYRFDEIRGDLAWTHVIPVERRAEVRARYENLRSPEDLPRLQEVEWQTRTGQRRLISWNNAVLLDETGMLRYMIGTGIDITERKRAERALIESNQNLNQTIGTLRETQSQLVQSEKMASLGALVAGISHEINTPIGIGVTSATALHEAFSSLKKDFEGAAMKRSTLEQFIAHGQSGTAILVSNLLRAADLVRSFKQVAVDQSSDEWRQLNLREYIDEVLLSLKPRLKGGRVEVLNECAQDILVYTHPGAIYQVISNLVINSIVHAYDEGQAGVIRIAAERTGNEVQIDFSDDGKGVPVEIQGRIFDPFFTTRRGAGGSGLGLHIVFNLVVSTMGGVISLVKDVRKGATFRIRFPLKMGEEAA